MLIILTLTILLVITLLSILSGGSFISGTAEHEIYSEIIINGTTTTLVYEKMQSNFIIDPLIGGLIILTVIIVFTTFLGARLLGSGLADSSISTIRTCIMYGGIWITLSLVANPLIESISTIGTVIYISLTIFYILGVFQTITGGGGSGGDGF